LRSGLDTIQYPVTEDTLPAPADPWRMDHNEQLRHLPLAHAVALRMHEAGADEALIAAALAIEPECVGPLLALARAKSERIARNAEAPGSADAPTNESS
jgi:hypothetical protein